MSAIALGAIGLYRRHLSPLKGFRCAHNALHGRGSCSEFGLEAYARFGTGMASRLVLHRLRQCSAAYGAIMTMTHADNAGAADLETGARQRNKHREGDGGMTVLGHIGDAACMSADVCSCLGGL